MWYFGVSYRVRKAIGNTLLFLTCCAGPTLISLKLLGYIGMPWGQVLLPFIIPAAGTVFIAGFLAIKRMLDIIFEFVLGLWS